MNWSAHADVPARRIDPSGSVNQTFAKPYDYQEIGPCTSA
jgi:hypothetical protein